MLRLILPANVLNLLIYTIVSCSVSFIFLLRWQYYLRDEPWPTFAEVCALGLLRNFALRVFIVLAICQTPSYIYNVLFTPVRYLCAEIFWKIFLLEIVIRAGKSRVFAKI
jgi:hypothetical protein